MGRACTSSDLAGTSVAVSLKSFLLQKNRPQIGPQMAPKTAQEAPKTAQEAPKTAQEAFKTAQEAPGTAQEAPKTAQEAPKTLQERLPDIGLGSRIARGSLTDRHLAAQGLPGGG